MIYAAIISTITYFSKSLLKDLENQQRKKQIMCKPTLHLRGQGANLLSLKIKVNLKRKFVKGNTVQGFIETSTICLAWFGDCQHIVLSLATTLVYKPVLSCDEQLWSLLSKPITHSY